MKQISLSQEQVTQVDDHWFEYLNQWNWCAIWAKNVNSFYAIRSEYYRDNLGLPRKRTIYMHRLIMNTPKKMLCDHINHDTLNNQEYNLRNSTDSRNQMNRKTVNVNNKSTQTLGVYTNGSGFRGAISIKKKLTYSQTFHTMEEAVAWRKAAEEEHYGEFSSDFHKYP